MPPNGRTLDLGNKGDGRTFTERNVASRIRLATVPRAPLQTRTRPTSSRRHDQPARAHPGRENWLKDAAGEGERWLQLWTHVLEEFALRFGPYPAGFAKEVSATLQAPKTTFPAVPAGYKALSRLDL